MKFLEFLKFSKLNEQEEETWFDVNGNPADNEDIDDYHYNNHHDYNDDDDYHDDDYHDDDDYDDQPNRIDIDSNDVENILTKNFPDKKSEFTEEDIKDIIDSYDNQKYDNEDDFWEDIVNYIIEDILIHKEMKK